MLHQVISVLLVLSVLVVLGCADSNQGNSTLTNEYRSNENYMRFPDTNVFLDDWSRENTLVCHISGEPTDLHPLNSSSATGRVLSLYLHGYLVVPDPSSLDGLTPGILQSMPVASDSGLVLTCKLRNGITWDDESALTVDDVIFSYKAASSALINNPHYKPYADAIKTIKKDKYDSSSFHIHMTEKNIQNVGIPTLFPILQESIWDAGMVLRNYTFEQLRADAKTFDNDESLRLWASEINDWSFGKEPSKIVGLGPYQFSEWNYGQNLKFVLKENHWSKKVEETSPFSQGFPNTIVFKVNADPNSQELEFKAQTYDASETLSIATFNALTDNPLFINNYNVAEVSSYT